MLFVRIFLVTFFLSGCGENKDENTLKFATSGDYPPFEYVDRGVLTGFDVDLAHLIGEKLKRPVEFEQMPFQALVNAVQAEKVNVAIATLTVTDERAEKVDFTNPYYFEKIAVVYKKDAPHKEQKSLEGKKISVQMGSTMEIWIKKNISSAEIISVNTNNQAVESLKSGQVDAAILDGVQATEFVQKNDILDCAYVGETQDGYAMILKKGSVLTAEINAALQELQKEGKIEALKNKWINKQNG